MSEPPWSPIDSNKTKQSSEKSDTAGFINTLRKEFQSPDRRDALCLPNTAMDYMYSNGFTITVINKKKSLMVHKLLHYIG